MAAAQQQYQDTSKIGVVELNEHGAPVNPKDLMNVYMPRNDGYMELNIGEPVLVKKTIGDYHEYPINGRDSLGAIECLRRFSHFALLFETLSERYPGLYIPPIPPKDLTNKKGAEILEERRYFLDLFLKECCALDYIVAGEEL